MSAADCSEDLRRRVDRTVDYLREILAVPDIDTSTRLIADAVVRSLTTPAVRP